MRFDTLRRVAQTMNGEEASQVLLQVEKSSQFFIRCDDSFPMQQVKSTAFKYKLNTTWSTVLCTAIGHGRLTINTVYGR